jgi:hypothetical protein
MHYGDQNRFGEKHAHIADLYYNIGITYAFQNNKENAL